jgi:KamA family protein
MTWAKELQNNVTGAAGLREYRSLSPEEEKRLETVLHKYPMRATRYYLSLVNWEDYEKDPIYRLCVPTVLEEDSSGSLDTSGESTNTRLPGLQHKYRETVLVLTTHECAMYCRHCFRKRLVGLEEAGEKATDPKAAASYIRSHPEVSNVLLSGGDSFLLSNQSISEYLDLLTDIPHLDFIRFGTRIPVTFPMRITDDPELLSILRKYGRKKQIFIVTHFNHPREITEESIKAVRLLREAGLAVRNQTVLLRGVNDDPEILSDLFGRLTGIGVLPYYIFQCRPVTGVKSQFQVPIKEGFGIVEEARGRMNGQAKSFRFVMSHKSGKIEILGPSPEDGRMTFKYNQAKDREDLGRIFFLDLEEDRTWLD